MLSTMMASGIEPYGHRHSQSRVPWWQLWRRNRCDTFDSTPARTGNRTSRMLTSPLRSWILHRPLRRSRRRTSSRPRGSDSWPCPPAGKVTDTQRHGGSFSSTSAAERVSRPATVRSDTSEWVTSCSSRTPPAKATGVGSSQTKKIPWSSSKHRIDPGVLARGGETAFSTASGVTRTEGFWLDQSLLGELSGVLEGCPVGCRECGTGSVPGTPAATTGRVTKKETYHDDSADGQCPHRG